MRKFSIPTAVLIAVMVASIPLTSFAITERFTEAKTDVESVSPQVKAIRDQLREEVDTKREKIEANIEARRAAITEKLSGKRADDCEKKEGRINEILTDRTVAAQRHFDTFATIQDRLVAYVAERELSIENGSALEIIMDDSRASAQAAIDAVKATAFICEQTDANAPGKIITEQVAEQKQALIEYRAAIKDYASAVKAAIAASVTTEVETETEAESETAQ